MSSAISNSNISVVDQAKTGSRTRNVVLWVLQIGLAIQIGMAGVLKLAGTEAFVDMFNDIGIGQWFRFVVGALEVAGAIGLLIPMLSGLAALGLIGLLAGATITNLFVIDANPASALIFLVVAVIICWGRWSTVKDLAGKLRR
jgi:putative oxidoreductase